MTEREKFEAWVAERCGYSLDKSVTGVYEALSTHEIWMSWQASRAAALEEAAKECDLMAKSYDASFELERADAAEQCAMGIRALKGE